MRLQATEVLKARGWTGQFNARDATDKKTMFFPFHIIDRHHLPGTEIPEFLEPAQARLVVGIESKTADFLGGGMPEIHLHAGAIRGDFDHMRGKGFHHRLSGLQAKRKGQKDNEKKQRTFTHGL